MKQIKHLNKTKKTKVKAEKVLKVFCEKLLQNIDGPTMVMDNLGDVVFANDEYLYFFCFSKKDIILVKK